MRNKNKFDGTLRGATAPGHMIHILVARSESKVNFRSLASLDDRKISARKFSAFRQISFL
ncbi:hypothetical protein A2943_02155 [Candidatus Adlerbacteria bacterium RIFCSPLOWO2_01_FULL_51_16]|uniref:Uncharacterized protein n=1 Tax=Candidatus Adlerbacteria bacterium RIFCSPLOWO2_01_FULL_51_16 TaxID=1797243 RepID=A0A1F4XFN3_9BACT|nr:MAG: hypothetical protein A2943_02155 [Candidatus Adlerbacteria bacterium RIFCSPLOWO2_01_FULL_51_16]